MHTTTTNLPMPLIPEAPLDKHLSRNFSTGSVAVCNCFLHLCFSSALPLSVAIFTVYCKEIHKFSKYTIKIQSEWITWDILHWKWNYTCWWRGEMRVNTGAYLCEARLIYKCMSVNNFRSYLPGQCLDVTMVTRGEFVN